MKRLTDDEIEKLWKNLWGKQSTTVNRRKAFANAVMDKLEAAKKPEPVRPKCKVNGFTGAGMCAKIIVGGELCGYEGNCEHKEVPQPDRTAELEQILDEANLQIGLLTQINERLQARVEMLRNVLESSLDIHEFNYRKHADADLATHIQMIQEALAETKGE